jgi:hypothetical protein
VLAVVGEPQRVALREELADDARRIDFADKTDWYRSPRHAFDSYNLYLAQQLARGVKRVRVIGDVLVPVAVADWARHEATASLAYAPAPVSFLCAYNARELPTSVLADAPRTHPLLRAADGTRPSAAHLDPALLLRELA